MSLRKGTAITESCSILLWGHILDIMFKYVVEFNVILGKFLLKKPVSFCK